MCRADCTITSEWGTFCDDSIIGVVRLSIEDGPGAGERLEALSIAPGSYAHIRRLRFYIPLYHQFIVVNGAGGFEALLGTHVWTARSSLKPREGPFITVPVFVPRYAIQLPCAYGGVVCQYFDVPILESTAELVLAMNPTDEELDIITSAITSLLSSVLSVCDRKDYWERVAFSWLVAARTQSPDKVLAPLGGESSVRCLWSGDRGCWEILYYNGTSRSRSMASAAKVLGSILRQEFLGLWERLQLLLPPVP